MPKAAAFVPKPTVAAWLRPEQCDLVEQAVRLAGLRLQGVGTPARGQAPALASRLDCAPLDDLRAALAEAKGGVFLLADPDEFGGTASPDDARAILAARERGVRTLTIEPLPSNALLLNPGGWLDAPTQAPPAEFVPLPRALRALRQAVEPLQAFRPPSLLAVQSLSRPHEGSLAARLFAAMDLVRGVMGEPETIDAAYSSPPAGPPSPPGESLRTLTGSMTANLRFAGGRSACVVAGDRAGRWNTTATLIAAAGRLAIYDDGLEWIGPDGGKLDQQRGAARGRGKPRSVDPAVAALADALDQAAAMGPALDPPFDMPAVFCMAQAAILSARTGQPESPATIRHMAGLKG
ncbi:MAG: hypothetical protein FJ255_07620 [Phycisphaerae bacterium]|nr:hypothetical protein [Phycisphaerae bacterium]